MYILYIFNKDIRYKTLTNISITFLLYLKLKNCSYIFKILHIYILFTIICSVYTYIYFKIMHNNIKQKYVNVICISSFAYSNSKLYNSLKLYLSSE